MELMWIVLRLVRSIGRSAVGCNQKCEESRLWVKKWELEKEVDFEYGCGKGGGIYSTSLFQ
jgi:hypothetical protein